MRFFAKDRPNLSCLFNLQDFLEKAMNLGFCNRCQLLNFNSLENTKKWIVPTRNGYNGLCCPYLQLIQNNYGEGGSWYHCIPMLAYNKKWVGYLPKTHFSLEKALQQCNWVILYSVELKACQFCSRVRRN